MRNRNGIEMTHDRHVPLLLQPRIKPPRNHQQTQNSALGGADEHKKILRDRERSGTTNIPTCTKPPEDSSCQRILILPRAVVVPVVVALPIAPVADAVASRAPAVPMDALAARAKIAAAMQGQVDASTPIKWENWKQDEDF